MLRLAIVILLAACAGIVRGQAIPNFEVASIRTCPAGTPPTPISPNGGGTPGRIRLVCQKLEALIRFAHVAFANGRRAPVTQRLVPIEKLPGWAQSESFTIEAAAAGTPSADVMLGPMLQ